MPSTRKNKMCHPICQLRLLETYTNHPICQPPGPQSIQLAAPAFQPQSVRYPSRHPGHPIQTPCRAILSVLSGHRGAVACILTSVARPIDSCCHVAMPFGAYCHFRAQISIGTMLTTNWLWGLSTSRCLRSIWSNGQLYSYRFLLYRPEHSLTIVSISSNNAADNTIGEYLYVYRINDTARKHLQSRRG
jgi:hypothetical protein